MHTPKVLEKNVKQNVCIINLIKSIIWLTLLLGIGNTNYFITHHKYDQNPIKALLIIFIKMKS